MEKLLLSLHDVAAVVLVGPVTAAVGAFPRCARTAAGLAGVLHRTTRAYAVLGLSVPVVGIALAGRMGVLRDAWVLASVALTVAAAALLAVVVLPEQTRVMGELAAGRAAGVDSVGLRAAGPALFALTWVAVVVLMVVRPGSTTGV